MRRWHLVGMPDRYLLLPAEGGESLDIGSTPWRDPLAGSQG